MAVDMFTQLFLSVLDQHAPWTMFQVRKKYVPWITNETMDMIKIRNKLKDEECQNSRMKDLMPVASGENLK